MGKHTHGFRLKGTTGHYEHTTAEGLEQARKVLGGPKFFAKNYEVKELDAEKPADLPTTKPKPEEAKK